jgi:hypothetical protein
MANVKFLTGTETNLLKKVNGAYANPIVEGSLYVTAEKVGTEWRSYLYYDTNGERIKVSNFVTKASQDDRNQNIAQTYIKAISMEGTKYASTDGVTLTYTKGDGNTTTILMPVASATTAGTVITGAQTFAGKKTFTGQVVITGGIDAAAATANSGSLLIGSPTGSHIAIDANEIQAKSNGTTASIIYINNDGGTTQFGGNVQPKADNSLSLGTDKLRWKIIYGITINATTFNGALNGNVTGSLNGNAATADKWLNARNITLAEDLQGVVTIDGSKNVTLNARSYSCSVGGGNTANYPWHRIATTGNVTASYNDKEMIIAIRHSYDGGGYGVAKVSLRTNNISTGNTANATIKWLYRYNISKDALQIGLRNTSGNSLADLYYKVGTWPRCTVYQLQGSRSWTLISSTEVDNTTSADKKTSTECYTSISDGATKLGVTYTNTIVASDGATVQEANHASSADGAKTDDMNNVFKTHYLANIGFDGTTNKTTKVVVNLYSGSGALKATVDFPTASASAAGAITTGAQTLTGAKTLDSNGSLTIQKASGFNYSGIENNTGNSARNVWFSHSSNVGTPVKNDKFKFNPGATDTWATIVANATNKVSTSGFAKLIVDVVEGMAARAYADDRGNTISSKYVSSMAFSSTGTTVTLTYKDGTGADLAAINVPVASASSAGVITNAAQTIAGDKTFTGMIYFPNISSGLAKGIQWTVGDNDYARIRAGATASNGGYLEIATADDYNEPIHVRQYSGVFATVKRTLTLLNGSGNTIFPGVPLATSNNAQDIGTTGTRWKEVFAYTFNATTQFKTGGSTFYANSSGDGYFARSVGIRVAPDTNYALKVTDNSLFNGILYFANGTTYYIDNSANAKFNTLTVNSTATFNNGLRVGNNANGDTNYIAFYGTTGDGAGSFNHTYIGENRWGDSESSELLLFKGNDMGSTSSMTAVNGSGPDRIRHVAAGHLFQTYETAVSGSWTAVCDSTVPKTRFEIFTNGTRTHGTAYFAGGSTYYINSSGHTFLPIVSVGGAANIGYNLYVQGTSYLNGNVYLPKNGNIYAIGTQATTSLIRVIDNTSDAHGNGISIGGGGVTIIGAGESAQSMSVAGGTEVLYLLADGAVNIEANADTIANRIGIQVTTAGAVIPVKAEVGQANAQSIGTSGNYFNGMYTRWLHTNMGGSGSDGGITLYNASSSYAIYFRQTSSAGTHSYVTSDWATYFTMSDTGNRGWIFKRGSTNVASISGLGYISGNRLMLNRAGGNTNGRIYWYHPNYYTWVDYMSDPQDGLCPTNGKPSTTTEVTSWARRSLIENAAGYGWIWEATSNASVAATTKPTARMSLSSNTGRLRIEGNASSSSNVTGQLIVSSELNGGSGNVGIELWRGGNASWQLANEGGVFSIRCNYNSAKQTTYSVYGLIMDHTTGAASLPYLALGQTSRNTSYRLYVNGTTKFDGNVTHNGITYFANGTTYYVNSSAQAHLNNVSIGGVDFGHKLYVKGTSSFNGNTYIDVAAINVGLWFRESSVETLGMYVSKIGTAATQSTASDGTVTTTNGTAGVMVLRIGNNKDVASTSGAHNARGNLWIYGTRTAYTNIQSAVATSNRTVTIPNASGYMGVHLGRLVYSTTRTANQDVNWYLPLINSTDGQIYSSDGARLRCYYYYQAANIGFMRMTLGNAYKVNETTGNQRGEIYLYSAGEGYNALIATTSDANYTNYLPASSGTLLNTATYMNTLDGRYVKKSGDTMTGALTTTYLTVTAQNTAHEGGEIKLNPATSSYKTICIDSYDNYFRLHDGANERFKVDMTNGTVIAAKFNGPATEVKANQSAPAYNQTLTYFSGQIPLGTAAGNAYAGSSNNRNLWSFPAGNGDENGSVANVQVLRMSWGTTYWQEIFCNPNHFQLWYRAVRSGTADAWKRIWIEGNSVTGAVWNDYAECREADTTEYGYVLTETGKDSLTKTTERLQHFAGVSSDTWGFSQGETEKAKTPIAVAGRVLVYTYQDRNNYKPGDCVCAAPGGTVDIMTREEIINYPDRIVGTVSCVPTYEEWGGGEGSDRDPVKVNGRIWIKVK